MIFLWLTLPSTIQVFGSNWKIIYIPNSVRIVGLIEFVSGYYLPYIILSTIIPFVVLVGGVIMMKQIQKQCEDAFIPLIFPEFQGGYPLMQLS